MLLFYLTSVPTPRDVRRVPTFRVDVEYGHGDLSLSIVGRRGGEEQQDAVRVLPVIQRAASSSMTGVPAFKRSSSVVGPSGSTPGKSGA